MDILRFIKLEAVITRIYQQNRDTILSGEERNTEALHRARASTKTALHQSERSSSR